MNDSKLQSSIPNFYFVKIMLIGLSLGLISGCANQEMLNAQPALVEQNTAELLSERPDTTDVYYVGFAADSTLKVFSNEVNYAKQLLDDQFGTKGRSVVLLNNSKTAFEIPMATQHNLDETLRNVSDVMDKEEDMLFVFLSGHGTFHGDEYGLYINYGPNHKGMITPQALKKSLSETDVKWKVLIVSACFSGHFADEIADSHTLVITASDPHNPSFGCSSADEYTYFGEAYFVRQLPKTLSLIKAFEAAKKEITEKENAMGYPNSNPTMAVSQPIEDKLSEINL